MSPATQPTTSSLTLVPLSPAPTDTPSLTPEQRPRERHLTVTPRSLPKGRGYVNTPQIILRGLYLEKNGFTIGSKVIVIEKPGEIIIRLDGASAEHDPKETPDDRLLARKVKQVTDYQQSSELPLSAAVISQYLNGKMPIHTQRLLSRLVAGEVPESYHARVCQFLNGKKKPATKEIECDSLLWEIDQLPRPRRKRAARQAKPPGIPTQPILTNTTQQSRQAATVQDNFINPPAPLQVDEPSANPPAREFPPISGLDPGRSYIRNVLRSLPPLPPPPPRDPGPTLRELMERAGPAKPPEDYPEIPARFREFYTAEELEIYEACRSIELDARKQSQQPSAQNSRTGA